MKNSYVLEISGSSIRVLLWKRVPVIGSHYHRAREFCFHKARECVKRVVLREFFKPFILKVGF